MKRLPMEDTPINFSNFHPAPGRRLDVDLRRLKKANGTVWYYRESPEEEPSGKVATVMHDVIQKIMDLSLPIKLSEKDFQ